MNLYKICIGLMGLSLILSAPTAFAAGPADQDIISQLQKIRQHLSLSTGATSKGRTPQSANCTFESYCQQFAEKAKDFYLYQNAEGRQIPNLRLIRNIESAEACLGHPFSQAPVQDPFMYPDQLAASTKSLARYDQESKRVKKIFNDVQDRMVQVLKSRRTKENYKFIDNMIARITTVNVMIPKSGSTKAQLEVDGCDIPNAGYRISDHKIVVCPQLLNIPDAALFSTLAHELGHPIDPCQMSMSYTRQGGVISQNNDLRSKPSAENLFISAIRTAQNPFKDVVSCLQKPDSMNVVIPKKDTIISFEKKSVEDAIGPKQANESGTIKELRDSLDSKVKSIQDNYEEFKYCYNFSGSGEMTESFGDWMSATLLKQKVSEISDTKKAQTYAAESQMLLMATSCININEAAMASVRPLIQNRCPDLLSKLEDTATAASAESATHPSSAKRVNRIIYAPPEIQKALGCQKDAGLIECK